MVTCLNMGKDRLAGLDWIWVDVLAMNPLMRLDCMSITKVGRQSALGLLGVLIPALNYCILSQE